MKKGYWLILVFALWCVACALWYMFGVRGISTDPQHFSPHTTTQAIVEILVMILGGFIIGFGLAWLMREDPLQKITSTLRNAQSQITKQHQELQHKSGEIQSWQKKWEEVTGKLSLSLNENEGKQQQLDNSLKQNQALQKQAKEFEQKVQQLDGEVSSVRFRIRLLENEVAEKEASIKTLNEELEKTGEARTEHREWSDHPFVRPVEQLDPNEKDDLTQIKGIGAVFQRKLNSLDIFSFRQLSELSGEAVERLAEVISVFPERIHRDNWIGQATKLYMKKLER